MKNNVFIMNAAIDKVVKAHTGYITVQGYINLKYIRTIGLDYLIDYNRTILENIMTGYSRTPKASTRILKLMDDYINTVERLVLICCENMIK